MGLQHAPVERLAQAVGGDEAEAAQRPGAGQPGGGVEPVHDVVGRGGHGGVGGAAVRISMTVGQAGEAAGRLLTVIAERGTETDTPEVTLTERNGRIQSDLTIGADIATAKPLLANLHLSSRGVQLIGAGFIVAPEQAQQLGLGRVPGIERHIRLYRNGRDLTATPRDVMVIDLFGLSEAEARARFPEVYQWVLELSLIHI